MSRRLRDDRGSITTELVLVTPVAIALLCLVALVGRTASAREQVDEASRDAARAASLERDPPSASWAAEASASRSLTTAGFDCAATRISVDATEFTPGGQVTVRVECDVPLSDLGLIGLSGVRTVESSAVSVIDTYRGST